MLNGYTVTTVSECSVGDYIREYIDPDDRHPRDERRKYAAITRIDPCPGSRGTKVHFNRTQCWELIAKVEKKVSL